MDLLLTFWLSWLVVVALAALSSHRTTVQTYIQMDRVSMQTRFPFFMSGQVYLEAPNH